MNPHNFNVIDVHTRKRYSSRILKAIYFIIFPPADPHKVVVAKNVEWAKKHFFVALVHAVPMAHGRRNFKDTNPLILSSLVILFGVVKQFGRF
jgi:hypothetical protein